MKSMFGKAMKIGKGAVDAAAGAVDNVKEQISKERQAEMVEHLQVVLKEKGVCPVCGTTHG